MSIIQSESAVQTNRHPYTISYPGQLTNLALTPGMSIKSFLWRENSNPNEMVLKGQDCYRVQVMTQMMHQDPVVQKPSNANPRLNNN